MKTTKTYSMNRRDFLKKSAAASAFTILPSYVSLGQAAPSDRLRIAAVGIGNQGVSVIKNCAKSNRSQIVALCDIDLQGKHVQKTLQSFPDAKTYTDFRKMFDQMADKIDAVIVATPDHAHFAATILAMSLGKHVFVEKPLAHTFGQCERLIKMAARNPKLVTQMGNQGHSGPSQFQHKIYREAGLLNGVTRITAHMNSERRWHGWGASAETYPEDQMPSGIEWDQWHDVVDVKRPFSKRLHPQEWRSWFEFGCGAFGDWGPHILDNAHRYLELGLPATITPVELRGRNVANLIYPQASTIRFSFPERSKDFPACEVTWYDGVDNIPPVEPEYGNLQKDPESGKEVRKPFDLKIKNGSIMYAKDFVYQRAAKGSPLTVIPRDRMKEVWNSMPKYPQKNSNHYDNFVLACLGEEEARSPFSISGPLSQVFNLGMIAQRLDEEIQFDPKSKTITNNKKAQSLLDPAPRKGWEEFYKF